MQANNDIIVHKIASDKDTIVTLNRPDILSISH